MGESRVCVCVCVCVCVRARSCVLVCLLVCVFVCVLSHICSSINTHSSDCPVVGLTDVTDGKVESA